MDDFNSRRTVAPGTKIIFKDPSLARSDWDAFLAGKGSLEIVNRWHITHTLVADAEFFGDVVLSLDNSDWQTSKLLVHGTAHIAISREILLHWGTELVKWLSARGASTDPDVWLLMSVKPDGTYADEIWGILSRPENASAARLAIRLARRKRSTDGPAVIVVCDVQGIMSIATH
jgi:hypothetical protein